MVQAHLPTLKKAAGVSRLDAHLKSISLLDRIIKTLL